MRKKNVTDLLSPQQLIDCSEENDGCGGGKPDRGFLFKYLRKELELSKGFMTRFGVRKKSRIDNDEKISLHSAHWHMQVSS